MNSSERDALASPWTIVIALSLLLGLQPIATDLYLPALPQMRAELGWLASEATWTLSALILAFGIAQMVWGPVADRLGRKPVLLWGLGLFVVASGITMASNTLLSMTLARALQGASLAASVVCGRAMIRDLYPPEEGARVMAKAMTGLGALALTGPILGSYSAVHGGWRASLGVVGAFGLVTWLYVALRLPETWPAARRLPPPSWRQLLAQWRTIARQPIFRAHAQLTSSTYGGLYAYLALSAFVFIDTLGISRPQYGVLMASISLVYILGTLMCRQSLQRLGLVATVRLAGRISLAALVCLGVVVAWRLALPHLGTAIAPGIPAGTTAATPGADVPAWSLLPGLWLYGFAHGIHQPCGQTGVVSAFPQQAGAASALAGFTLSSCAVAVGAGLSLWTARPAFHDAFYPMVLTLMAGAAATAHTALVRVQRDGAPPLLA